MYINIFSDLFLSTYMRNCINYFLLLGKKKQFLWTILKQFSGPTLYIICSAKLNSDRFV